MQTTCAAHLLVIGDPSWMRKRALAAQLKEPGAPPCVTTALDTSSLVAYIISRMSVGSPCWPCIFLYAWTSPRWLGLHQRGDVFCVVEDARELVIVAHLTPRLMAVPLDETHPQRRERGRAD